ELGEPYRRPPVIGQLEIGEVTANDEISAHACLLCVERPSMTPRVGVKAGSVWGTRAAGTRGPRGDDRGSVPAAVRGIRPVEDLGVLGPLHQEKSGQASLEPREGVVDQDVPPRHLELTRRGGAARRAGPCIARPA